ncbi:MAG TPA: STAS domain-containing protein [Rhodospirillaceae bacterium]|nr:STAS domain-containing protein [Rhodospirillaceae bacterium]
MSMTLSTRRDLAGTGISVTGEVDLKNSGELRKELLAALAAGRPVAVELSQVAYIDSSGIAALVEAYQTARRQGLAFTLADVSPAVLRVLKLARLDQVFDLVRSSPADPP